MEKYGIIYDFGSYTDYNGLTFTTEGSNNPIILYQKIIDIINNIITSIELNQDGTFNKFSNDEHAILGDLSTIKECLSALESYVLNNTIDTNIKLIYENEKLILKINDVVKSTINLPLERFLDKEQTMFIDAATEDDKNLDNSVIIGSPYLKLSFNTIDENNTNSYSYCYIPMGTLVDIYEGENTSTLFLTIKDNKINGKVNISQNINNALVDNDGLFVNDFSETITSLNEYTNLLDKVKISDAPKNNTKYVRENGEWVEFQEINPNDYITKVEATNTYQPIGDYATTSQLNDKVSKDELSDYLLKNVADEIYATKSELPEEYSLPIASNEILGGIKVGNGLEIDNESGMLSVIENSIVSDVEWDDILNKPQAFNPSEHLHNISEINGLQTELDKKVNKDEISDMLTKTEANKNYQPIGNYITETDLNNTLSSIIQIKYKEGYSDDDGYVNDEIVTDEEGFQNIIISRMFYDGKMWCNCCSYKNIHDEYKVITGGPKYQTVLLTSPIVSYTIPNCLYRVFYIQIPI